MIVTRDKEDTVGKMMGQKTRSSEQQKSNHSAKPYNKNTDSMMTEYVEDLIKMIPDSGKWQPQMRKEARVKLRTLVEE